MNFTRITIKPRFWILLLVVFSVVFYMLYAAFDSSYQVRKAEETRLLSKRDELLQEVYDLRMEIDYVHSEAGIERYARAMGMIKPGEIKYEPAEK